MGYLLLLLSLLLSCQEGPDLPSEGDRLIDTRQRFEGSTSAGNLVTSAMGYHYKLDMVFYPSSYLRKDAYGILNPNMTKEEIESQLYPLYAGGNRDLFRIGTMKGRVVKNFLKRQTLSSARLDLQVFGVRYSAQLKGGFPSLFSVTLPGGTLIDDNKTYRVAVNDYLFGPQTFPGYKYGAGLMRGFRREAGLFSAREALWPYLESSEILGSLDQKRATFQNRILGTKKGMTPISQIQGFRHLSPYLGYKVQVEGIVTATGQGRLGRGRAFYLQSEQPDEDPRTSEAIYVALEELDEGVVVGSKARVEGVVYEDFTTDGLSRTGLREISSIKILSQDNPLPLPVVLGPHGVLPPRKVVSRFIGNVNQKDELHLDEALDFWESLEGMRVVLEKPEVVGVSGGKDDLYKTKSYLNIFVVPSSMAPQKRLLIDQEKSAYNPQIIRISDHSFSNVVLPGSQTFNVGDKFDRDLTGIFTYQLSPFGSGEYVFYPLDYFASTSTIVPLKERGITPLAPKEDELVVANFNVENLSAVDIKDVRGRTSKMKRVSQVIREVLKCPDILNLVEIMDNNGDRFSGGSVAKKTLDLLIEHIACPGVLYAPVNKDPLNHREGGKPGGNIRVAMIYNKNRVSFKKRGRGGPLDEAYIMQDGRLNLNPARLAPSHKAFRGTRRPLVAEFTFKGKKVFVIGNHFNSKGGDSPVFGAMQPPFRSSEYRRSEIALQVHRFVAGLVRVDPKALVVVLGDFNDFHDSRVLTALKGAILKNLVEDCDPKERYTYNYGGNSQALDHIFISNELYNSYQPDIDILHINTDFMGQVSDHDPMLASFNFGEERAPSRPCQHRQKNL